MPTVTLEEAQARLPELIEQLVPGEPLVITRDDRPIAKVTAEAKPPRAPREPGFGKGWILYMAPDFNAPLDDFREYME